MRCKAESQIVFLKIIFKYLQTAGRKKGEEMYPTWDHKLTTKDEKKKKGVWDML